MEQSCTKIEPDFCQIFQIRRFDKSGEKEYNKEKHHKPERNMDMLANYHTHTWRCRHASGEEREYIENAIANGMQVLGFSDHCPWLFPDGTESGTRMKPSQLDGYFTTLTRLRDEYRRDITIYIGFESEYIPELMEAQNRLLSDYPVDYQILGEHFMEREPFGAYLGQIFDEEAMLRRYVDICIEGMETGRYRYVAHPDLMGFSGDPAVYDREYGRLCAYLAAHGIPVEINLLGVYEGRHYTDPRFLRIAAAAGCQAIIGCDAHTPDRLNCIEGQAQCVRMAEDAGLSLVTFLPGLGRKCTDLRGASRPS